MFLPQYVFDYKNLALRWYRVIGRYRVIVIQVGNTFVLIFSLEMSWSRVCVDLAHHSRFFAWKKVYEGGGGGVFGSGGAEGFS